MFRMYSSEIIVGICILYIVTVNSFHSSTLQYSLRDTPNEFHLKIYSSSKIKAPASIPVIRLFSTAKTKESTSADDTIKDFSDLPNDFQDAVQRACDCTLDSIAMGSNRCRIDFDTTIGDVTFTSLQNTLPMVKEFVKKVSTEMDLSIPPPPTPIKMSEAEIVVIEDTDINDEKGEKVEKVEVEEDMEDFPVNYDLKDYKAEKTIRLFFPDMGAAALARRDWRMGTPTAEIPPCITAANIQNDDLLPTDKLAILLCPLHYEADFVKRVLDLCDMNNTPLVMINPDLISMDQGYGVRKW